MEYKHSSMVSQYPKNVKRAKSFEIEKVSGNNRMAKD